jgi:NTE family protein
VTRNPSPVAFVLSGGAGLGAIQVGMLRALYERGVAPDLIVATSAGAIKGAFIASREQIIDTADELAAIWRHVTRSQIFPLNLLSGLLGFLGTRANLVPDSGLRRLVAEYLAAECLEDLPIPLHVVAVDVITGEELLLSAGPLLDAVIASAAIPAVLPPVRWQDRQLMDAASRTTRRSRTPSSSARARSTCCPPGTRARSRRHPAAPWAWRCTRSACSPTAG